MENLTYEWERWTVAGISARYLLLSNHNRRIGIMDLSLFALGLGAIVAALVALDIIVTILKMDSKEHKEDLLRSKLDNDKMLLDHANIQLVQNGLPPVVTREDITSA